MFSSIPPLCTHLHCVVSILLTCFAILNFFNPDYPLPPKIPPFSRLQCWQLCCHGNCHTYNHFGQSTKCYVSVNCSIRVCWQIGGDIGTRPDGIHHGLAWPNGIPIMVSLCSVAAVMRAKLLHFQNSSTPGHFLMANRTVVCPHPHWIVCFGQELMQNLGARWQTGHMQPS